MPHIFFLSTKRWWRDPHFCISLLGIRIRKSTTARVYSFVISRRRERREAKNSSDHSSASETVCSAWVQPKAFICGRLFSVPPVMYGFHCTRHVGAPREARYYVHVMRNDVNSPSCRHGYIRTERRGSCIPRASRSFLPCCFLPAIPRRFWLSPLGVPQQSQFVVTAAVFFGKDIGANRSKQCRRCGTSMPGSGWLARLRFRSKKKDTYRHSKLD